MANALGRKAPETWEHIDKYPLKGRVLDDVLATGPRPVVIGINWYENFDDPQPDPDGRHYWIGRGDLGNIRGGHCVCLKPRGDKDWDSWWTWYNQVSEGICVGEGTARMLSTFNRKRYQPRWIYNECKKRDGWPNEEGTSVSVGLDVVRELGAVTTKRGEAHWLLEEDVPADREPSLSEGIRANRWARSVDDTLEVLGYTGLGYVDIINSWGRDYPHLVRLPIETLQRLFDEDGEFGVPTDK